MLVSPCLRLLTCSHGLDLINIPVNREVDCELPAPLNLSAVVIVWREINKLTNGLECRESLDRERKLEQEQEEKQM